MAGKRIITPGELEIATGILAANKDLTMSKGEGGSLTLMPGDFIIRPENGQFTMTYPPEKSEEGKALETELRKILMGRAENATRGSNLAIQSNGNNSLANSRSPPRGAQGSALDLRRRRDLVHRVHEDEGHGQAPTHRSARRRHEGVRADRDELRPHASQELRNP